jgi:hypothetical protein
MICVSNNGSAAKNWVAMIPPCMLHSVFVKRASAAYTSGSPMHKTDLNHQWFSTNEPLFSFQH